MTRAELQAQFQAGCTRLGELVLAKRQLAEQREAIERQFVPLEIEHDQVLVALDKLNAALTFTEEPPVTATKQVEVLP